MIKVGTVFSGIGAFEHALKKSKITSKNIFACDNGERYLNQTYEEIIEDFKKSEYSDLKLYIDEIYNKLKKPNYVKESFLLNHEVDFWYEDIRFFGGIEFKDKIDIFVGGSPCQSFSIIGKKGGLEDARGTLFYDYARLINTIQPKVFIFENVVGLLSHDKGKTWKTIQSVFDNIGYSWKMRVLNSLDYGIPQDRKRVFVVGFKKKEHFNKFEFPEKIILETSLFDYLEKNVEEKYYLGKKGFEFVTNPKYKNRARVNKKTIQTQKANQQFNWNGDFYFEGKTSYLLRNENLPQKAHLAEYNNELGIIRKLTPKELLRLMGFEKDFKITSKDVEAYRQIGNSIVVNILENLMVKIIETGVFNWLE